MEYVIKIRGRESRIRTIPSLVAVLPDKKPMAGGGLEASGFGKAVPMEFGKEDIKHPLSKGKRFQKGGWLFVEPRSQVRKAADDFSPAAGAQAVRHVYEGANGTLVGTNRVTLQLAGDVPPHDAEKILAEDGLRIVRKLAFAKNLYEAEISVAGPILETIGKLQELPLRYRFIEPVFIESLGERQTPEHADFGDQWHHLQAGGAHISSQQAWLLTRGAGVRIAVIDRGLQVSHPGLEAAIQSGGYFLSEGSGEALFRNWQPGDDEFPDHPHGTFCCGMAAARANGQGVCGSAPESELIPVACTTDGLGSQVALARALAFAADPASEGVAGPARGADVIVCSLGPGSSSGIWEMTSALELAITAAAREGRNGLGIPVFWAASNGPHDIADDQVCSHPDVLAISRSTRRDEEGQAAFGDKLEFLAPGVDVVSTKSGGGSGIATGCSFAAPLAAGVAALLIGRNPGLTRDQIRARLRNSCDKIGLVPYDGAGRNAIYGYGRINAGRAVADDLG
jgi:subtilisin family serine protease